MATVKCTLCGALLKTKAAVAPGKKMKCPKCQGIFVVPGDESEADEEIDKSTADEDEIEETPPKKASKGAKKSKRQDDDEEDNEKPKKSKHDKKVAKKSPVLLIVGLAVVLLLCLGGVGGTAGWFFFFRGPNTTKDPLVKEKDADSKGDGNTTKTGKLPDFAVTAESITQEQAADFKAYQAKYKNKILEVTGEVYSVTTDIVFLKGIPDPKLNSFKGVRCEIPRKLWDKSHVLARGQKVKVTGKTEAFSPVNVELMYCSSLVELESKQLPKMGAEEIAKALDAGGDSKATQKRLDALDLSKGAIVTATVDRVMPRSPNRDFQHHMYWNLQTKTRLVLVIEVPSPDKLPVKGQTIEFRTTSGFYNASADKEFQLPGILLSVK